MIQTRFIQPSINHNEIMYHCSLLAKLNNYKRWELNPKKSKENINTFNGGDQILDNSRNVDGYIIKRRRQNDGQFWLATS